MTSKPKSILSIIVPVFYNADSLPFLFDRLSSLETTLHERNIDLELIFVDDGSGDSSFSELLKIKTRRPETKVVRLTRNFGAVAASKTGFSFVTGDAFMVLAADLQDPPEQVELMADQWQNGSRFVISVREAREDPVTSTFLAWLYYRLVGSIVMPGYPKGGYDLMLMDRSMLPHLIESPKNTNPSVFAFWLGHKPTILPYRRMRRPHGRSRWTLFKKLKYVIDTICGFSVFPIRAMSLLGIMAAFLGGVYGLDIIISAALGKVPVAGFATIAALICFFSGLILLMLGTLGEYLWRVFDAVNGKPESVIDEVYL